MTQTLGNGNINLISPMGGQPHIIPCCTSEDRKEKLSRYRNKKTKRNFGRKIKVKKKKKTLMAVLFFFLPYMFYSWTNIAIVICI